MTGRAIIAAALRKIGALAPSESVAASEASDGLSELNRMIANWSTEGLIIYTRTREAVAMTPGTATYTMGTGGTFSATRAIRIHEALIRDDSASPAIEYPVRMLTLTEWSAISQKDASGSIPHSLYADGAFPSEVITVYPRPTIAHKLVLFSDKPLSSISTLDATVSLPSGYEDAIIYNLAVRLAPEYGRPVPDAVAITANESKANIKRANHKPAYLSCDAAIAGRGGFNMNTGDY